MENKVCSKCGERYPATLEFFHKRSNRLSGLKSSCKNCGRKASRKYYLKNKKAILLSNKARRLAPKGKAAHRRSQMKIKYGITELATQAMMNKQKGCCLICEESLVHPFSVRSYSVDHDHSTGEVRGLLCHGCNIGLGGFRDSIESLHKAIKYLRG